MTLKVTTCDVETNFGRFELAQTLDGHPFGGTVTMELSFRMEVPGLSAHVVFHNNPSLGDVSEWSKRIMKALSDEFKPEREKEISHDHA